MVATDGVYGEIYRRTAEIVREFNDQQTDSSKKMTVEVRIYNGNNLATDNQIKSVIAIMQQYPLGAPPILRVSNEPNNVQENAGSSLEEMARYIAETQYKARQMIYESGGGIYLASEMLDVYSTKFGVDIFSVWEAVDKYIQENPGRFGAGVTSYHDLYDVYSINGYFTPGNFGNFNGITLERILDSLPPGKAWRFSEFGYLDNGPKYTDPSKMLQNITDLFAFLANNPKYFNTFAGFNIFTRDPHNPAATTQMAAVMQLIANHPDLVSVFRALDAGLVRNEAVFNAWLDELIKQGLLVNCCTDGENTCSRLDPHKFLGFAAPGECQSDFGMPGAGQNQCSVNGTIPQEGVLRPNPCYNCTPDVPEAINVCGEPPTLVKSTTVNCSQLSNSGCGDTYVKRESWVTTITIDTSETKVPFAGWHDIDKRDGRSTNPNTYLNDYLEGTALYDDKEYDLENLDPDERFNLAWEAGVFRRLAPQEIQDSFRKKLITSGYDYEIKAGSLVKKMSDWNREPFPFDGEKGRFPPEEDHPNYPELHQKWIETDWGKLWYRIPLFTREDAPGAVMLTAEHDPGNLTVGEGTGRQIDSHTAELPLAIPHLARLYEASAALQQLVVPSMMVLSNTTSENSITRPTASSSWGGTVIAQSNTNSTTAGQVLATQNSCNNDELNYSCSRDSKALEDPNDRLDTVCCDNEIEVEFPDYVVSISNEEYDNKCENPKCVRCMGWGPQDENGEIETIEIQDENCIGSDRWCAERENPFWDVEMSRQIDVQLKLPYLEKIWENLAKTNTGVFNIFKPAELDTFPEYDAGSGITFQTSDVRVIPNPAQLYFPYLGGIQQAKKCISEQLLTPQDLQNTSINWCDWENPTQFNDTLAYEYSCNGTKLADMSINPILEDMVTDVSNGENIDKEILYAILRNETGLAYFNNPQSNSFCAPNYCAAQGPMQILNGWQNVNCDPDRGKTCGGWCDPETKLIYESARSAFSTWDNYGCSGNICDLKDSLTCAAKILKGKAGVSELRISNKEAVAKAMRRYHGDSCTLSNELDCCRTAGDTFPHLCGQTYCGYALWFLGL